MKRLILKGSDAEILGLITRLKLAGAAEIAALIPEGESPRLRFYAEMSETPLAEAGDPDAWPQADLLVSVARPEGEAAGPEWIRPADAEARFLEEEEDEPDLELEEVPAAPALSLDLPVFARELRREIRRSRRYHLSFCLSLFQVLGEDGRPLPASRFLEEPLLSLPRRVGRNTDSWGLSPEGVLLHLAPEIMEGARLLKRRLTRALDEEMARGGDGPWRVISVQAAFPQEGERASQLVGRAQEKLRRLRERKEEH